MGLALPSKNKSKGRKNGRKTLPPADGDHICRHAFSRPLLIRLTPHSDQGREPTSYCVRGLQNRAAVSVWPLTDPAEYHAHRRLPAPDLPHSY